MDVYYHEIHVLSDESNEKESTISGQSTSRPDTPLSEDSKSKGQADVSNLEVTTCKRNLIEYSKLTKFKSMDELPLPV